MRRRGLFVPAVLVVLGVLGGCSDNGSPAVEADGGTGGDGAASSSSTTEAAPGPTQTIDLELTGDTEVPGPGSDGTATATLSYDGDQLCIAGGTDRVGALTAGHIHAAPAGESGDVVIDFQLSAPADSPFDSCVTVGAEGGVVFEDRANYYANLHTAEFPDGAVRAQLG